jgi:hypothetical protein
MLMRRRSLAVIVSLACSVLCAEAVLRFTGRLPIPPERIEPIRPELYQAYEPYGYRVWPSRTLTYSYPKNNPRRLTVHSNRHGFRGARELDSEDTRPRLVVLGDSMVFGEGVEESERFTEQLEASEPAWRVDNLGMTGFGPDLMVRAFEHVGMALHPRRVILTIYTDDFRRVRPRYAGAGFRTPRYTLEGGRLVSIEYPRLRLWTRWSTTAAIREATWRLSGAEWKLNAAILDRFRDLAANGRFELVLLFLPGTSDTANDVERRTWLRDYAQRTNTAFLDLTDAILREDYDRVFIKDNFHLTAEGHRVVARALQSFLTSKVQPC